MNKNNNFFSSLYADTRSVWTGYSSLPFFYFSLLLLLPACTAQQPNRKEEHFENKIKINVKSYPISDSAARLIEQSKVMRAYYYASGKDTGFVCRTLDLATYFLPDYTYVNQYGRIPVTGVSPRSDIYCYKGQLLAFDTKEKLLYPVFSDTAGRQTLFTLADSPDYYPSLPYSAQLIGYKGRPVFIYNYQLKRGGSPNYVDSTVFLLVTDSATVLKFGKYPPELRKKAVRYPETYFCTDTADNIYYVHAAYDSVYKTDISGTISGRNVLHINPVRPPYHPEKEADLAYVRKYEASIEKNCRIAICMNKYIVVLKKMSEPDLLKKPKYKYFVFDTQLHKLYVSAVSGDIIPVILPTRNGFLLPGTGFKKIYHYELP